MVFCCSTLGMAAAERHRHTDLPANLPEGRSSPILIDLKHALGYAQLQVFASSCLLRDPPGVFSASARCSATGFQPKRPTTGKTAAQFRDECEERQGYLRILAGACLSVTG